MKAKWIQAWRQFWTQPFALERKVERKNFFYVFPCLVLLPIVALFCLGLGLLVDSWVGSLALTFAVFLLCSSLVLLPFSFCYSLKRIYATGLRWNACIILALVMVTAEWVDIFVMHSAVLALLAWLIHLTFVFFLCLPDNYFYAYQATKWKIFIQTP